MKLDEIQEKIKAEIGDEEIGAAFISLRLDKSVLTKMEGPFGSLTVALCIAAYELLKTAPDPASAFAFRQVMKMAIEGTHPKEFSEIMDIPSKGRAS